MPASFPALLWLSMLGAKFTLLKRACFERGTLTRQVWIKFLQIQSDFDWNTRYIALGYKPFLEADLAMSRDIARGGVHITGV